MSISIVSHQTISRIVGFAVYDERERVEFTLVITTINAWNRFAVGFCSQYPVKYEACWRVSRELAGVGIVSSGSHSVPSVDHRRMRGLTRRSDWQIALATDNSESVAAPNVCRAIARVGVEPP